MFSKSLGFHIADDFIAETLLAVRAEENNGGRTKYAEAIQQCAIGFIIGCYVGLQQHCI